jgi:hypothetical protein
VEFVCYEEGSPRTLDPTLSPFAKHLPVDNSVVGGQSAGVHAAEEGGDDAVVAGFTKSAFGLSLAVPGEIGIEPLGSGRLSRALLRTAAVVLVDTGFHLYLWVGSEAAFPLRVSAFTFAQAYLQRFERPSILPLSRFAEGQESDAFWRLFSQPGGYRIDAKPEPARVHPMMRAKPKPRLHARSNATSTTSAKSTAEQTGGDVRLVIGPGTSKSSLPSVLSQGPQQVPKLETDKAAAAAQEAMGTTTKHNDDDDDDDEEDV